MYSIAPNSDQEDKEWADRIVNNNGKFILWFRHGERDKWSGTVTTFDFFDATDGSISGNKDWQPAVCLNPKGKAESELVGKTFQYLKIHPISIVSSPSCRAKQTAMAAFGRVDEEWLEVLHPTAISVEQQNTFAQKLKLKLDKLAATSDFTKGPVVVTGHGNTLPYYNKILFTKEHVSNWNVNELGFYVIELTPSGWVAQHAFVDFFQFANSVLKYPN
jgi:phosphohistidine phosphatase SixA